MIIGDINSDLSAPLKDIDIIIHLAGKIYGSKEELIRVNYSGTQNILACSNAQKIIFISSYRSAPDERDPYGYSKYLAEELIKNNGIKYTILKPTLIYGPGDNKNLAQSVKMVRYLPIIPIIGNGNYTWQPLYIDDLVDMIIVSISNKKTLDKIYIIAGKAPIQYNTLMRCIASGIHKKRYFIYLPCSLINPLIDITSFLFKKFPFDRSYLKRLTENQEFSNSEIKKDMGYAPISFEEGLYRTIKNKQI